MTSDPYLGLISADQLPRDDWEDISSWEDSYSDYIESPDGVDLLVLVAIGLMVFMLFRVIGNLRGGHDDNPPASEYGLSTHDSLFPLDTGKSNRLRFISPYENYILTQGPHGAKYGHLAIDLAAGEGAIIRSPIQGLVTERFIDEYGNPTLIIENDIYRVTLLHGIYEVTVGDILDIGYAIGVESNLGYTTDMWGNSCRDRDCGYHTHINVYDKRIGANVNPLSLIR